MARRSHTPTPPQLITVKSDLSFKLGDLNATYDLSEADKTEDKDNSKSKEEELEKTFDLNSPISEEDGVAAAESLSEETPAQNNDTTITIAPVPEVVKNEEKSPVEQEADDNDNSPVVEKESVDKENIVPPTEAKDCQILEDESILQRSKNTSELALEKDIEEMTASVLKALNHSNSNNTSATIKDEPSSLTPDIQEDKENSVNVSITVSVAEEVATDSSTSNLAASSSSEAVESSNTSFDSSPSDNSSLRRGTFTVNPKVAMVSPMAVSVPSTRGIFTKKVNVNNEVQLLFLFRNAIENISHRVLRHVGPSC